MKLLVILLLERDYSLLLSVVFVNYDCKQPFYIELAV